MPIEGELDAALAVLGGSHLVAEHAHADLQRLARVVVVLDDEDAQRLGAGGCCSGRRTTNSLPRPRPGLDASTHPECSSTSRRTTVRPMPRPPCERSSASLACAKKSKMCG